MKHIVSKNVFSLAVDAVNEMILLVASTYGPSSNKVIIGKPHWVAVLDDGAAIVREYEDKDPAKNEILKIVKEIAFRTNDRVGDGTTGSLLMGRAILNSIAQSGNIDGKKVEEELKAGLEDFKSQISKKAHKIKTQQELEAVARVSFDNPEMAKMIAELIYKIGADGVIAIEETQGFETSYEHVEGLEFNKGLLSPYLVTDANRRDTRFKNPYILVTDYRLTEPKSIVGLMEKLVEKGKRELVIIAEGVEGAALSTCVTNRMNGAFNTIVVEAPMNRRDEFYEDVCLLTGATLISEKTGIRFNDVDVKHLGSADQVIGRLDKTTIVGGNGGKKELKAKLKNLREELGKAKGSAKEQIKERIGKITGGVAVIKIGAPTEQELKALKYKLEDAVNATKVAFAGGVVPGAGVALANIKTSSEILNRALKQPRKQLLENMGVEETDPNVFDPVDVLIAGVESAVSIASLLATTKGIIVEVPDEKKDA